MSSSSSSLSSSSLSPSSLFLIFPPSSSSSSHYRCVSYPLMTRFIGETMLKRGKRLVHSCATNFLCQSNTVVLIFFVFAFVFVFVLAFLCVFVFAFLGVGSSTVPQLPLLCLQSPITRSPNHHKHKGSRTL